MPKGAQRACHTWAPGGAWGARGSGQGPPRGAQEWPHVSLTLPSTSDIRTALGEWVFCHLSLPLFLPFLLPKAEILDKLWLMENVPRTLHVLAIPAVA